MILVTLGTQDKAFERLLKAIDKFDFNYDVKFSTYAVPMILGEIRRFLRDDGLIKVSRTLKETALAAKSTSEKIYAKIMIILKNSL